MSSSVNESNLEKKFLTVTNTQDSIQTLSLWILHHKTHHKKIVEIWMKVLSKAKVNHRLTLFYLANDVIQNGKRKGYPQFGESFSEVLREATLLVRSEKIRPFIERVFNIWEQRNVYGSDFVSDLHAVLVNSKVPKSAPSKLLSEFKHENVISKVRQVMKLEMETASKIARLNVNKLNATDAEILQQLKDRARGQRFSCDFEEATVSLEEVITALDIEVKQRTQLILLLEQSEIYYDTQRGEAKVVANAYKNFGTKVRALQRKLEDIKCAFPSPVPSPFPDAPSPTNSDLETELTLPCDKSQTLELASIANAPSPTGSPEGLALTPPSSEKSDVQNGTGNPIPTLSNFFPQGPGLMSSWLDAFSSKTTPTTGSPKPPTPKTEPSSLDRRLSSFMQNIPNLSTGLQNTLFDVTKSGNVNPNKNTNSPLSYDKDENPTSMSTDAATPVKDECSGQNTPLQDEDNHSCSSVAFTGHQTLNSKSSQSSKDILRGLTSLIQTASGAEKSNAFCSKPNISEFIKKIAPSLTQLSPASASCTNSSQNPVISQPIKNLESVALPTVATTADSTLTYPSVTYTNTLSSPHSPHPSSERHITKEVIENLSFIPTLVPSTTRDSLFSFSSGQYSIESRDYVPLNADIEGGGKVCIHDSQPSSSLLSQRKMTCKGGINDSDIVKGLRLQRQSTLITVVAETKPQMLDRESLDPDDNIPYPSAQDHLPCDNAVKDEMGLKWHYNILPLGNTINSFSTPESDKAVLQNITSAEACKEQELLLPTVTSASHNEVQKESNVSLNDSSSSGMETDWKQSKIETVESYRNNTKDYRWFEKDWEGFQSQGPIRFHNNERDNHYSYCPDDYFDHLQKRNVQHTNFHARNWNQRDRNCTNNRNTLYGSSQPKRFSPFSGRSSGWKTHHHQF